MKKLFLSIILCFILTSCGESKTSTEPTSTGQKEVQESSQTEISNNITQKENSLEDLEEYLLDKGVLKGERTKMAADMIGAIDGFKYGDVEIYEYDTESQQYQKLLKGEEIEIEGMSGITVEAISINGKFVLMGENDKNVIQTFESFDN